MGLHIFRKTPCCVGVFLCLGVRSSSTVAALVASVQVDMSAKNPGNNIQTRLEYKYQGCQLSLSAKNGRTGPVLRIVNKNIIYLCLESLRYTYLVAKKKTTFHHPPAGTLRPHGPPWLTPAAMHGTSSGISVTPRHTKPQCFSVWMHACMYVQYCYHYPYHIHMLYYACISISLYIYISVCVYVHIYI